MTSTSAVLSSSTWLAGKRSIAAAVVSLRPDLTVMYRSMVSDIMAKVLPHVSNDTSTIPASVKRRVLPETAKITAKYFVGADGRHPFAADDITPLAEYPRIINRRISQVLIAVTRESSSYMTKHLPKDLYNWYSYGNYTVTATEARLRPIKIVDRDPFAGYEAPHFWVDPRGYRLSDRIWEVSTQTRTMIDQILSTAIDAGTSSYTLSRILEASLIPGRDIRTVYPYGKNVSYPAMRLARTEINRAHNYATLVSARANPFVDGIDWALSAAHPRFDVCDGLATVGMSGERIKDPYSVFAAQIPPAHPQCICGSRQVVSKSPDGVVANLRAELEDSRNQNIRPYVNPLQYETFLRELMGGIVFGDASYAN